VDEDEEVGDALMTVFCPSWLRTCMDDSRSACWPGLAAESGKMGRGIGSELPLLGGFLRANETVDEMGAISRVSACDDKWWWWCWCEWPYVEGRLASTESLIDGRDGAWRGRMRGKAGPP